jgi:hypothetical protein
MSNLLEITGDDIALLGDGDFRTLIGLLCEADYRLAGLPTKGITWGGHQDAKDGGLDVVIRGKEIPPANSFVPRSISGFQVKKPDMPKAEILKEMRPKGQLREEIKNLIKEKGAYLIACSSGSTSLPALKSRIDAMKEAVADQENHEDFCVDFLDRGRIATWVRSHPSLILWVRNKIGRHLNGWRPYESWAWVNAPDGTKDEYILDNGLRLHDKTKSEDEGMSVENGLLKLRSALSVPGVSVRLTGLSGVGKTRLVQALFDERIGESPLNPSYAFYADISDSPNPDPKTFVEQLIAGKTRAILIVDNCAPDLHRQLTNTCSQLNSTVSLLTVEYDVRDDLPEETRVFRLEPADEEIITKLIRKRFQHISQVDAYTIAKFSGGNARIAIALADTVQHGETLSGFRDEELFVRLFRQRHDSDGELLASAEVCSLVYSFEGTDVDSEESELNIIASLINKSGSELYRHVKLIKDRDLIQSRGVWRAVLPHAIANRLARRALESIPKSKTLQVFHGSSERLIKSFARRLGYLHDCDIAIEIVKGWLSKDGWLGKAVGNLNTFGMDVFENIAPVSPEITLESIECVANGHDGVRFTSLENSKYSKFVHILRHLAYYPELFSRSINLVIRFALSERVDGRYNTISDILKSLFYISLSGTHAPAEARAKVIDGLVNSEDLHKQELGLFALDAALETWRFSSSSDFGFRPKTHAEQTHWYKIFIDICTHLALSDRPISRKARRILSDNLRGLWANGGMYEALESSARQIHEKKAWNEGWIAVRSIVRFDRKSFTKEVLEKLDRLEKFLEPNNLLQRSRAYALLGQHGNFDLGDDFADDEDPSAGWEKVERTTRELGGKVAQDVGVFNNLLPELLSTESTRLYNFGKGLADGSSNKKEIWSSLRSQYGKTSSENRQINVLVGFISGCSENDLDLSSSLLDSLINDEFLAESFPIFQANLPIDKSGIARLHEALKVGKAKAYTFRWLALGRSHEPISDDDLADLLKKILSMEGGIDVVIEILKMRFHGRKQESPISQSLVALTRDVLSTFSFSSRARNHVDYDLARLVNTGLNGSGGVSAATTVCGNLKQAMIGNHIYNFDYPELLGALARAQSFIFLDIFLGDTEIEPYLRRRMFSDNFERRSNPLDKISDKNILSWCDISPGDRYPLIASAIRSFSVLPEDGGIKWKPIVFSLFEKAPNLSMVLEHISENIRPTSWSGSLADILHGRSILFESLYQHDNEEVRAWAKAQYSFLQDCIEREREIEACRSSSRHEAFE